MQNLGRRIPTLTQTEGKREGWMWEGEKVGRNEGRKEGILPCVE